MRIETLVVGAYAVNCYLVWDDQSHEGFIIDPGDEAEKIVHAIERHEITPRLILLTHGHTDHIGAVNAIRQKFALPLHAGKGEEDLLGSPEKNLSSLTGNGISLDPPEQLLSEGDTVAAGPISFSVLETPGHSPGGICLYGHDILFCGDTLFYGSVGRTDFPGCSSEQLFASITTKLLPLPDQTVCYPGHGPSTTIGQEKEHNPFLNGEFFA